MHSSLREQENGKACPPLSYLFTLSALTFQLFAESLLLLGIGCLQLVLLLLQGSHLLLELVYVLVQEYPEGNQCTLHHSVLPHSANES